MKLSAVEAASLSEGQSTARLLIKKLPEKATALTAKMAWADNIQPLLKALRETMAVFV